MGDAGHAHLPATTPFWLQDREVRPHVLRPFAAARRDAVGRASSQIGAANFFGVGARA